MRRRAQNFPAAEPAEEGEHSFQGEVPPDPPRRRRGRGRPRAYVAHRVGRYGYVSNSRNSRGFRWAWGSVIAVGRAPDRVAQGLGLVLIPLVADFIRDRAI